jgi:PD-(D/E)XK nuclease superfamily
MAEPYFVSVTELGEYFRCRRLWDYTSLSRKSLSPLGSPAGALHTGSCVHLGLEAQGCGLDWRKEIARYVAEEEESIRNAYLKRVGTHINSAELIPFQEQAKFAITLLSRYFQRFGDRPLAPYEYIIPELTFCIPTGLRTLDGRDVFLVGTFDGVARDTGDGSIWVVENKTFSTKVDRASLDVDHQMLGYVACLSHLLGEPVAGLLYNGIGKVLPREPNIRKTDGRVSREAIVTTGAAFREALVKNGQSVDDPEYIPLLKRLDAQDKTIGSGGNPFWVRYRVPYTSHARSAWYKNAYAAMREIASDPPITYSRLWEGCYFCSVEILCRTEIRGGDLEAALKQYGPSTYGTRLALKMLTPDKITCIEDLEAIAATRMKQVQEQGHL